MSLVNGNGSGGGLGEPIPRYLNPSSLSGAALPDRRRRGKNLGGNYYGPRGDRYQGGGNGYQRSHRAGGGGDGPHNGASGYHHRSGSEFDPQQQQHSPTDSHGSGRSNSHRHQGSMNPSGGQQQHYHYQQHGHHQYQKQDYEGSSNRRAGGDHHHNHNNQHHHNHHSNHYNNHHHRINIQTQQQHITDSVCPVANGHRSHQGPHSAGGYAGGGNITGTSPNGQQSITGVAAPTTEMAVMPQSSQLPQEHVYPSLTTNGSHYQQHQTAQQVSSTTMIQQFPTGMSASAPAGPATTTVGFYGYHPNSQPMFGSLALCHIPYGINPSSVISPVVYTQIIGSGMLTPGLPYNLTCGIPAQFLQPASAAPMILHPPQQQSYQSYPHQPHHHHHYHPHQSQYTGGQSMHASNSNPSHQHAHPTHHHQHNQNCGVVGEGGGDACALFDSSSLLNPDADAFFPPAFPPSSLDGGDVADISGELGGQADGIDEEEVVVVNDDEIEEGMGKKLEANVHQKENSPPAPDVIEMNVEEMEEGKDNEQKISVVEEPEVSNFNSSGGSINSTPGDD